MMKNFDELQKMSQDNFDKTVKSLAEVNKAMQAIASEMTDYTKKSFEEGTSTFEKVVGAKSVDQAMEIQTSYAKKAYEDYIAEMTKISEMYADIAKEFYKPVEKAIHDRTKIGQ